VKDGDGERAMRNSNGVDSAPKAVCLSGHVCTRVYGHNHNNGAQKSKGVENSNRNKSTGG